jgi:myo-inositol-hexaphosphate 3-phosphohydrolase/PKD repeat protein
VPDAKKPLRVTLIGLLAAMRTRARAVPSLLAALLALSACGQDAPLEARNPGPEDVGVSFSNVAELAETGTFPKSGVFQVQASGQTANGGAADDPAIWVHPTDRSLSLIIGANKDGSGGLHVYNLAGTQLQFVPDGADDNVDVRYGFVLGGTAVDLVSAGNRNNNHIEVHKVDATQRRLVKVGSISTGITIYGFGMYHSRATGKHYAFVNSKTGQVEQYLLRDQGGTVVGDRVRTFDVGGTVEGMVADDELGKIYIGEEARGVWKFGAEPGDAGVGALVDHTGSGGHLTADVEGVTIYYLRDGKGYLITSSQGANRFDIHRREGNNNYLASFTIPAGVTDAVTGTDGIDVTNAVLGSSFSLGMFVAHDDPSTYKLVPWERIANTIGLAIDTQGYDARGGGGCTTVGAVEVSPTTGTVVEGATLQLAATERDTAGNSLFGCVVSWATSDAGAATVSTSGLVTAAATSPDGADRPATITATSEGVSGTSAITVTDADPVAGFTSAPSAPRVGQPVSFTDASTSVDGIGWQWDFGTGAVSTLQNPVQTYNAPGTYTVTLVVQEPDGDQSTVQKQVVVTETPAVVLYFSLANNGTVGGLPAANEDIVAFDGTGFSLYFDGSDVAISAFTLDAFSVISSTEILMSFTTDGSVPVVGIVDDSDVLKFTATSLGATTAGSFTLYFDASDVGLTNSNEDVDAVELLADGRLLMSTTGQFTVPGVSGEDEDLVAFRPTSLGPTTAGTWELYFDGSDVGLTSGDEDVDAAAVQADGRIYLSTVGAFAANGVSGQDEDVFVFTPSSLGPTTLGTFAATLLFDGSLYGLGSNDVFAIDLP